MNDNSPKEVPLPLKKVSSRISVLQGAQLDRLAVLVMSGSFNPVHSQHTRALEIARTAMESSGWTIAGGYLAPSSESYLDLKLDTALSFTQRVEFCRLATQDSDWLDVCSFGEFSSYRTCLSISRDVERRCSGALQARSVTGIEVMGSDATIRIFSKVIQEWAATDLGDRQPWYQERIICCVIRPGLSSSAETELILGTIKPRSAEIGIDIILADSTRETLPLEAVSSSEIRQLLAEHKWDVLRERRWLHSEVFRRLSIRGKN